MEINRQYIGARYVPKFYEGSNGTEWDENHIYDPLTIVTYLNNSYTSKKSVPASIGDPMHNSEYWAATGNYNAQVEAYRQEVVEVSEDVQALSDNVNSLVHKPETYGAVGDGVTDDTEAINLCLANGGTIEFGKGKTYLVDADVSIKPSSNSVINLNGATIKAKSTDSTNYAIVHFEDIDNVILKNGSIIGDRDTHTGSTGEWGMCVDVYDCDNITIENCDISKGWGDGIYLYENTKRTKIINNYIHDCRRQGISVVWAEDVKILNNTIDNISGTAPESCIQIEPNNNQEVHNVLVENNILKDGTRGIGMYARTTVVTGVVINSNLFITNSATSYGAFIDANGVMISGNKFTGTNAYEMVRVEGKNNTFVNNMFAEASANIAFRLYEGESCSILNNSFSGLTLRGSCIYVNDSSKSQLIGNSIVDCETTSSDDYTMYIVRADNNKISGNVISDSVFHYAIAIGDEADDNEFVNNVIDGTYAYTVRDRVGTGSGNNFYLNTLKSGTSGTFSSPLGGTHNYNIIDGTMES